MSTNFATTISADNRQAWIDVAAKSKNPLNKTCKIIKGRKNKGMTVFVKRLIEDQYFDWKYVTEASRLLKQINGTTGYVALVYDVNDPQNTFWVKSEYLEIIKND